MIETVLLLTPLYIFAAILGYKSFRSRSSVDYSKALEKSSIKSYVALPISTFSELEDRELVVRNYADVNSAALVEAFLNPATLTKSGLSVDQVSRLSNAKYFANFKPDVQKAISSGVAKIMESNGEMLAAAKKGGRILGNARLTPATALQVTAAISVVTNMCVLISNAENARRLKLIDIKLNRITAHLENEISSELPTIFSQLRDLWHIDDQATQVHILSLQFRLRKLQAHLISNALSSMELIAKPDFWIAFRRQGRLANYAKSVQDCVESLKQIEIAGILEGYVNYKLGLRPTFDPNLCPEIRDGLSKLRDKISTTHHYLVENKADEQTTHAVSQVLELLIDLIQDSRPVNDVSDRSGPKAA